MLVASARPHASLERDARARGCSDFTQIGATSSTPERHTDEGGKHAITIAASNDNSERDEQLAISAGCAGQAQIRQQAARAEIESQSSQLAREAG